MAKRMQTAKQVKKSFKFTGKMLIWAIPVILLISIGFTLLNLPTWLTIVTNLIVGGGVCFIVYVIDDKIKEKKASQPKKPDPFSD